MQKERRRHGHNMAHQGRTVQAMIHKVAQKFTNPSIVPTTIIQSLMTAVLYTFKSH